MDLTVPGGLGGKEALRELRALDPGVKAIVSSGYSNDPIMADFIKHGFNGVVTKPYRIKELSDEVHRVINGQA
jgi:DNA-binding NarL/FixJ family response regulator